MAIRNVSCKQRNSNGTGRDFKILLDFRAKRKPKYNKFILHFISVIKYSYTGGAKPQPITGGGYDSFQVSMFPTLPVQGPQNHKASENISYSFCEFLPGEKHSYVICYQTNLHFLSKSTPGNVFLLLLAASRRLHLFSLISYIGFLLSPHLPLAPLSLFCFPFCLPFPCCPLLDHPVCFLFHLFLSLGFLAGMFVSLPTYSSFLFHSLVLVSFQLIPSLAPLKICLLLHVFLSFKKCSRQFANPKMHYLAIFLKSSLVSEPLPTIRNTSCTTQGSHTAMCKTSWGSVILPEVISQLP